MTNPRRARIARDLKSRANKLDGPVEWAAAAIGVLLLIVLFLVIVGAFAVLGGLITMVAWNYGVVPIVAASGGAVAKISLLTGISANIAISIVGRIFHRPSVETTSK